jgi:hypothetical protein
MFFRTPRTGADKYMAFPIVRFCSWKPVSSARQLQLKGASQRGQEPLDTEAEDATLLEAATKQRSENRDRKHKSVFDSDF